MHLSLHPQVFTSDLRGAGTDANVDISLFGTNATVTNVRPGARAVVLARCVPGPD
jgi:hypothetical protein